MLLCLLELVVTEEGVHDGCVVFSGEMSRCDCESPVVGPPLYTGSPQVDRPGTGWVPNLLGVTKLRFAIGKLDLVHRRGVFVWHLTY